MLLVENNIRANSCQKPVHCIGWLWNASWDIWRALWHFKLCLGSKDITLRGFCNVDWVGNANDWRSTAGHVFLVGVGVISWRWKIQPTITLFTTEADYMATSHCMTKRFGLGNGCGIRARRTNIHHVQQSRLHITCTKSNTPFLHQTYRCTTLLH